MRVKIESSLKAKSRGISLYPDQWKWVDARANTVGGRSEYFRILAELDKQRGIIVAGEKRSGRVTI